MSFLAVSLVVGIISLVFGSRLLHQTIFSLAQAKVRHDLASAWMVYNEKSNSIRDIVRLSAAREFVRDLLLPGNVAAAAGKLDDLRREYQLDTLTLIDARGRVVLRARQRGAQGDVQSADPIVRRALLKQPSGGTQIVTREELEKEGPDLVERAYFKFIRTPMAAEREDDHEEKGMMIRAAAPVVDDQGAVLGVLTGGVLLNRNYDIVDRVKDIVFKGEKYKGHDIGTATIFQGDLRIATNVLDNQGQRAVGTRVSREVNQAVLQGGGHWVGRAFVVRAWFITAYEPIRDIEDRIVGILYVGMLEKPYKDLRNRLLGTLALLSGLSTVLLLGLLSYIATNITRPLQVMVEATDKIARGDLNHRVEIDLRDEIGQLASSFNRMTDNLVKANDNLTQWGQMLEKRVEERTHELREMQDSLIRSEKLASLGKMAAGVAHEINNPLTSILINTYLILEKCPQDDGIRDNLMMISEETTRCAQVVKGLLDFARQTPSQAIHININDIIDRTVQILEKQASLKNIAIIRDLDRSLPLLDLDKSKIQQVFSNLIINACEAMPRGGSLTVTSRTDPSGRNIEIFFADTGMGIPKENLQKIFDPFFTTKSFGTGLGLAVSYGIIQQRGGTIDVESDVGRGSVFKVLLPLEEEAESFNGKKV